MPESIAVQLEEVSEEALKERVKLRKVTAAVTLYDQLMQAGNSYTQAFTLFWRHKVKQKSEISAGTAVSTETTHELLDLLCFYGDRDPVSEGGPQTEDVVSGSS